MGLVFATLTVLVCLPQRAWALQIHPAPEGLIAHQLAHVFFGVAIGVLAYWLEVNNFVEERGWRLIQISCLLLVVWNIAALAGHWVSIHMPQDAFQGRAGLWSRRVLIDRSPWALPFIILHFDHLVSVPAILCLLFGIRSIYRQVLTENKDGS
jgi:hypothetical protein